MRFMSTNLVTEASTIRSASSSNVNFPVSNLSNPLRSKKWRSSGTFVIDSSNNKIDFKDSTLATLSCSIPVGTYSISSLQNAIKVAMDAASDDTFTITFGKLTGLWTISSSGASLQLLNQSGTNQATSLLKKCLGFPNLDKNGSASYVGSLIAIHTKERIVFDFKTSQDVTGVVLLWPKEDGIKLTDEAIVRIQASATGNWSTPAVDVAINVNNQYLVAAHFFENPASYRYWSITIEDPQNPNLFVELGLAYIGEDLGFQEPENGFKFALIDQTIEHKTDFGHRYFDEYPKIATLDFDYRYIEYEVMQILEDAYRRNGSSRPVLVAFDEDELAFTKEHFLIYGTMEKKFELLHVVHKTFNGGLKITEQG